MAAAAAAAKLGPSAGTVARAPAAGRVTRRGLMRAFGSAGAGALALGMAGAAASCGGPSAGGRTDQAPSGTPRQSATLEVIYPPTSDADLEIFTRIFKQFEESHPGLTVNHDAAKIGHGSALSEKLVTMSAAATPPDVSLIHPSWAISLLAKGFFVELGDRTKKDKALRVDDILPYALDFYRWEGKLYGLPYYSGPGLLFFNKTLFEQNGVKPPDALEREGTWTWDALLEAAKRLTQQRGDASIFGYDGVSSGLQWYLSVPIWANGGEVISQDERQSKLHEAPAVTALQFQIDLLRTHHVQPQGDEARAIPNPGGRRFNSGRIAMTYGGKFYVPDFRDNATFDIGVVPVPKGPGGRVRATRDGNNGFGMLKGAKHVDEGYTLAGFFTQWDGGGKLLMESGRPQPVRKSVYDDGSFKKLLQPWEAPYHDFYVETAKIVRVWRIPKAGPEVQMLFDQSWKSMVDGTQSVKAAMEELRPRLDDLLRQAAT